MGTLRCWGDADAAYLKSLMDERTALVGPTASYYSLIRGRNVDPLYGEPSTDPLYTGAAVIAPAGQGWAWYPAFDLACTIEYQEKDNRETSARDEGTEIEYDAIISVAALEWTRQAPVAQGRPKEGDVIEVFGHHWDVVKANSGGNIMDTPTVVGWLLNVKVRESFAAERKLP